MNNCKVQIKAEIIIAIFNSEGSQKRAEKIIESWKFDIEDRKQWRNKKNYHRIGDNLRSKVRYGLRVSSPKILNSFNELIGCSFNELKIQLESKLTGEMSWDNFGYGWHIDHIITCWVFDLNDIEEQKKCFHYTNLQPMWAMNNFEKNGDLQTKFDSESLLYEFVNTHKLPASAKIKIKTNKAGKTTYRILFNKY